MADEKTPGGEISSGLRSIFERVGDFFHVFDLSFFVGGVMTFGALAFLFVQMKKPRDFPFAPWVGVLALIIACYVCGLIAFATGRLISGRWFRQRTLEYKLPRALEVHGLNTDRIITSYTARGDSGLWRLYIRMWSEVVHEGTSPLLVHHLMRYWAMAATYDGVGFSLVVWACVLLLTLWNRVAPEPIGLGAGLVGALSCLIAAGFSFRRGASYYEYQIEDIVAHFAVIRAPLSTRALEAATGSAPAARDDSAPVTASPGVSGASTPVSVPGAPDAGGLGGGSGGDGPGGGSGSGGSGGGSS